MKRRNFLGGFLSLGSLACAGTTTSQRSGSEAGRDLEHSGEMHTRRGPKAPQLTEPLGGQRDLLYLLYPGFTTLDFYGPHAALGLMGCRAHVCAANLDPVVTDSGVATVPTLRFDAMPPDPGLVLVPGGSIGTVDAARDAGFLDALSRVADGARYV